MIITSDQKSWKEKGMDDDEEKANINWPQGVPG
jgi:hypothetical protein